jgi:ABC-type dipeptide/oligopeptide/nickel transport system permease component
VLGVSAGIAAALNRGRALDKTVMFIAMLGISMPGFYLALLMTFFVGVKLGWLPTGGYVELWRTLWVTCAT